MTEYINNQTKLASSYFNIIERVNGTSDEREEDKWNFLTLLRTSPADCKRAYYNLLECGVSLHDKYDWLEQFEYTDWWLDDQQITCDNCQKLLHVTENIEVRNGQFVIAELCYNCGCAAAANSYGTELEDEVLTYL